MNIEAVMNPKSGAVVCGEGGVRGVLEPPDPGAGTGSEATRVVRLDDGRRVVVAPDLLVAREDSGFDPTLGPAELDRLAKVESVIPVVEEVVDIERRRVETGRLRTSKVVRSREKVVGKPLARGAVHVERVDSTASWTARAAPAARATP